MKAKSLLMIPALLMFAITTVFAQKSIIAGKVLDEHQQAIPGARIRVMQSTNFVTEVQADKDGLYYTQLLPQGGYNFIVQADSKIAKVNRVYVKTSDHVKRYYNLTVKGEKLAVEVTERDPFMDTKLSNIAKDDRNRFDLPGGSTGKTLDDNNARYHILQAKTDSLKK